MRLIGDYNDTGTGSILLSLNQSVEQTFISPLDYLNRIDLIFSQAPKLTNTYLKLLVFDNNNQVIAISRATLNKGQTNSFVSFYFSPIKNSQNQTFKFELKSTNTKEIIKLKTSPQKLVFRTYHLSLQPPVKTIFTSIADKFNHDQSFFIFYLLILGIFTVLVIKNFVKLRKNK